MPAVLPPAKVLVTGASGFLAASIIQALVDKNYSVVGTVRKASKGDYLKQKFGIDYVIVEDMEAVSGAKRYPGPIVNAAFCIAQRFRQGSGRSGGRFPYGYRYGFL